MSSVWTNPVAGRPVYLGFGFEGITGAATRNEVMDRIVDYLLR